MEHSMDPYEQQLLSVFNSYDISHCGSLDQEGLMQLCNSLQLEEQGVELTKCLLSDSKSRVTFNEFKDGLLALLGNVQNSRQKLDFSAASDNENDSPDQEISPKFVYGSKRYGRRSRPDSTEQIELFDNCNADIEQNSEVFMDKIENKSLKNLNKVQRSNSQSDVTQSRKRKTSGKLKRCTSFPGNHEMERQFKNWNQEVQLRDQKISSSNLELTNSMLQSVLDHLGIGADGYLTQLEIVRVCEYMGMHKLAKNILEQLTSKSEPDISEKRNIEEFLEIIQKDNFVYEVISSTHTLNNSLGSNCVTEDSVLFPNNKTIQYITMGPNGSGVVSSQTIVELWENAGIMSAASLLQELGFTNSTIRIIDLVTNLDEELRNLNDSRTDISLTNINPHIVLLQASIVLYQSEVKYLKSVLEQVSAERNKLKIDIADANQRASLLAQEVDDNHAKLEKSTQNQVRLLEQRHSDVLKEVTNQFVIEKEHMSILNSKLEKKILILENEESKLKSDLLAVQKFNNSLEKENHSLSNQLSELEQIRSSLCDKITILENECQKFSEIERERDQLEPLFKKLSLLQIENAELRDKNDELCTEVETLNSQITIMRTKMPSTPTSNMNIICHEADLGEENVSAIYEGVGLGAIKRRVDSPSKNNEKNMESPRLGKVRRCYNKFQPEEVLLDALGVHVPLNSSESGFEAELDCLDSSLSYTGSDGYTTDEVSHLQARISYLEQLLLQNSIKIPKNLDDSVNNQTKAQLIKRCKDLELILEEVKTFISKMNSMKLETAEESELSTLILHLNNKFKNSVPETSSDESLATKSLDNKLVKVNSSTETNESFIDLEKQLNEKIRENKELKERCEDLDQALEMMRSEFEHCENYWSNKLDEERQIFDQEQKQSSDKLTELLIKISEYEEQFTTHDSMNGRLSPIEEKGCLEQQFAELEDEFNEYKTKMDNEINSKNKEIAALQNKLNSPQIDKTTAEVSTQVDFTENNKINSLESKVSNLTNVIESTNIFSSETLPNMWQYSLNSDSIDSSEIMERENISSTLVWNKPAIEEIQETSLSPNTENNCLLNIKLDNGTCSLPPNISWQSTTSTTSPQPHSLNFIPDSSFLKNNNFCRQKRTRKHDRNIFTTQHRLQKKEQDLFHKQTESCINGQCRKNLEIHNGDNQTCIVPLRSIHHLHGRLRELDQHCRHLQFILKQQQRHSESVMHHCWQQHREEVNEFQMQMKALQDKLARSDMLIKDLYVENTYLMANNQRLEHRCHMLVQCSSESTSV